MINNDCIGCIENNGGCHVEWLSRKGWKVSCPCSKCLIKVLCSDPCEDWNEICNESLDVQKQEIP